MAITMKDIARDLGVSVMTVSKVLRNHSDIGQDTRRRVLQRIRELNYTPNAAAQALVTGRSHVVGLVVPDLVHPFFAELAKGVSASLRRKGYSLVISSSEEDPQLEQKEIDHLLARGVDALIVASVQNEAASFARIEAKGTPYVLIDRKVPGVRGHFIGVDDEAIGVLATEHLIATGRKRIAHIAGAGASTSIGRLQGYRKALASHGIAVREDFITPSSRADDLGDVSGYDAMKRLLALRPRPDAVFCINDPAAMGAMLAIVEAGLRIPEDVAVVGCGDVHYARFLAVPLTSIGQQTELMGRKAGQLALSLVGSPRPVPPRKILVGTTLHVRQSTVSSKSRAQHPRSSLKE